MESLDLDIFFEENLTSLDCSKLAAQIENFISSSDSSSIQSDSCDNNTYHDLDPDFESIFQDETEVNEYHELAKRFTTKDPKCREMFKENAKYRNSVITIQAANIQNPNMSRIQLCNKSPSSSDMNNSLEDRTKNTVAVRRSYVKMKIYAAIAEADATEANVENVKLKIRVATLTAYVNILLSYLNSKMSVWDLIQEKRKNV